VQPSSHIEGPKQ